jgi:hypothetical protein
MCSLFKIQDIKQCSEYKKIAKVNKWNLLDWLDEMETGTIALSLLANVEGREFSYEFLHRRSKETDESILTSWILRLKLVLLGLAMNTKCLC